MKQEVMAHCPPTSPRCRWAVGFPRSDPRVTTVSPQWAWVTRKSTGVRQV